jgi:mannitol-specific phosphotransferase system IIBC component
LDLRSVTGLGAGEGAVVAVAQTADWTTKLANIAGVIASLTTVGFGVANFIDQRKSSKEQKDLQERQQKMAEDQMAQDLKERQARLDAAKAQTATLTEQQATAAKQKELDASGYMLTPDGQVVPKPKNTALTVGAVGAAVAGAFLMSK